jgi:uncharacterized protein YndB with AHSA1/START domain
MSQTGPFGHLLPGATTPTLVFERHLAVPVEAAWRLITDPAALAVWLLADVTIEPRSGGAITMHFNNTDSFVYGRVVTFEPPHVLEYTWPEASAGGSVVRFELSPVGAGTRLVLTHALEGPAPLEEFGAGWHVHLDLLQDLIADRPVAWPSARWQELRAAYTERRAQAAAKVLPTA